MKLKLRIISLLLVLVMLLPLVVACNDVIPVELSPAEDKTPAAGELAAKPEVEEKVDAYEQLMELLTQYKLNPSLATISAKFKGEIHTSFLDKDVSLKLPPENYDDMADEDGFVDLGLAGILEMLDYENPDLSAIIKDILVGTVLDGGYADLGELGAGLKDNLDLDAIAAEYGSVEAYLTAQGLTAVVAGLLMSAENRIHNGYLPSDCGEQVEAVALALNEILLAELKGEAELVDTLEAIADSAILLCISRGSVCYDAASNGEYLVSFDMLQMTLEYMVDRIRYNQENYNGTGNYGLDVYASVFDTEGNREISGMILSAFVYSYFQNYFSSEALFDPEFAIDSLNAYLMSEDGPLSGAAEDLSLSKLLLAYMSAALSVVYTNEMIYFSEFNGDETIFALYNLSDNKWYDLDLENSLVGEEMAEGFTDGGIYGYFVALDNALIGSYNSFNAAFLNAGKNNVIYEIHSVEPEGYVDYEETVSEVYESIFNMFTDGASAINDELPEQDKTLLATALVTYIGSFLQQKNYPSINIDLTYAQGYILSVLSNTVLSSTYESVLSDAAATLLRTDDEEAVAEFVSLFAKKLDTESLPEDYDPYQAIVLLICQVMTDPIVSEFMSNKLFGNSGMEMINYLTAAYLYEKYIGELPEADGPVFDIDDIDNGVPVFTGFLLISQYAFIDAGPDVASYVANVYLQYAFNKYETPDELYTSIIYYEDLLAMIIMYNMDCFTPNALASLRYPFDFVKGLMTYEMLSKFADQYSGEMADTVDFIAHAMTLKIYGIKGHEEYPTIPVVGDMLLAISGDMEDEDSEIATVITNITRFAELVAAEADPDADPYDMSVGAALEYMLGALFVPIGHPVYPELSNLDLLIRAIADKDIYSDEDVIAIGNSVKVFFENYGAENGFESAEDIAIILNGVNTILNNYGIFALDGVIEDLVALVTVTPDATVTDEQLFDMLFTEIFGSELDYTVLTDVLFALKGYAPEDEESVTALMNAITAAQTALEDDLAIVGYLRFLAVMITTEEGASPVTEEGIINFIAYAIYGGDPALIIPVLFMSEEEFKTNEDERLLAIREWVVKYYATYAEADPIEMALDFLVAVGYFNGLIEIEEDDEEYYEKLAVVFAANEIFFLEDDTDDLKAAKAEAIVALIFSPENLSEYGDIYFEIARDNFTFVMPDYDSSVILDVEEEFDPRYNMLQGVLKTLFYLVSTKAYFDADEAPARGWEEALQYIPDMVYVLTQGRTLEIANYDAFAELIRPSFMDELNTSFVTTVVPYQTANEIVYVFTLKGDVSNVAVEGTCELVIEIRCPIPEAAE